MQFDLSNLDGMRAQLEILRAQVQHARTLRAEAEAVLSTDLAEVDLLQLPGAAAAKRTYDQVINELVPRINELDGLIVDRERYLAERAAATTQRDAARAALDTEIAELEQTITDRLDIGTFVSDQRTQLETLKRRRARLDW